MLELVISSVPKGLASGSFGFCAVASSRGVNESVVNALRSLSGYRRVYPEGDPRANPIAYSYCLCEISGKRRRVLSRVADAGLDYSNRTNKIASHVVLSDAEGGAVGPAAWLRGYNFLSRWNVGDAPKWLDDAPLPPSPVSVDVKSGAWERSTGDAGWAGVLASTVSSGRPVVLIVRPEQDVLRLFQEAVELLPERERWNATFSTYYTKAAPNVSCQWRAVMKGSPEEIRECANPNAMILDFTDSQSWSLIGKYEANPATKRWIDRARGVVDASRVGQVVQLCAAKQAKNEAPKYSSESPFFGTVDQDRTPDSSSAYGLDGPSRPQKLIDTSKPSKRSKKSENAWKILFYFLLASLFVVICVVSCFLWFHMRSEKPEAVASDTTVVEKQVEKDKAPEAPQDEAPTDTENTGEGAEQDVNNGDAPQDENGQENSEDEPKEGGDGSNQEGDEVKDELNSGEQELGDEEKDKDSSDQNQADADTPNNETPEGENASEEKTEEETEPLVDENDPDALDEAIKEYFHELYDVVDLIKFRDDSNETKKGKSQIDEWRKIVAHERVLNKFKEKNIDPITLLRKKLPKIQKYWSKLTDDKKKKLGKEVKKYTSILEEKEEKFDLEKFMSNEVESEGGGEETIWSQYSEKSKKLYDETKDFLTDLAKQREKLEDKIVEDYCHNVEKRKITCKYKLPDRASLAGEEKLASKISSFYKLSDQVITGTEIKTDFLKAFECKADSLTSVLEIVCQKNSRFNLSVCVFCLNDKGDFDEFIVSSSNYAREEDGRFSVYAHEPGVEQDKGWICIKVEKTMAQILTSDFPLAQKLACAGFWSWEISEKGTEASKQIQSQKSQILNVQNIGSLEEIGEILGIDVAKDKIHGDQDKLDEGWNFVISPEYKSENQESDKVQDKITIKANTLTYKWIQKIKGEDDPLIWRQVYKYVVTEFDNDLTLSLVEDESKDESRWKFKSSSTPETLWEDVRASLKAEKSSEELRDEYEQKKKHDFETRLSNASVDMFLANPGTQDDKSKWIFLKKIPVKFSK